MRYGELDANESPEVGYPRRQVEGGPRRVRTVAYLSSSASFANFCPVCIVCILNTWLLLCLS